MVSHYFRKLAQKIATYIRVYRGLPLGPRRIARIARRLQAASRYARNEDDAFNLTNARFNEIMAEFEFYTNAIRGYCREQAALLVGALRARVPLDEWQLYRLFFNEIRKARDYADVYMRSIRVANRVYRRY